MGLHPSKQQHTGTACMSLLVTLLLVLNNPTMVTGQTATVTVTIDITFDSNTGFIKYDQKGFVSVPAAGKVNSFSNGPRFRVFNSLSWGISNARSDFYAGNGVGFANTNNGRSCLGSGLSTDGVDTFFDSPIPTLFVSTSADIFLPFGYVSGNSLDGCAFSRSPTTLAAAGLVEGTCFFEYDADKNDNTGTPDTGYDVAIVWNVRSSAAGVPACPTKAPSSSPTTSQPSSSPTTSQMPSSEPSSIPSVSQMPSSEPSSSPSVSQMPSQCINRKSRKTKSPKSTLRMTQPPQKDGKTKAPFRCESFPPGRKTKAPKM